MSDPRPVNPLQGITLEMMLEHLVERYGWEGLGARIEIRCFTHDPSVPSSLNFSPTGSFSSAAPYAIALANVVIGSLSHFPSIITIRWSPSATVYDGSRLMCRK